MPNALRDEAKPAGPKADGWKALWTPFCPADGVAHVAVVVVVVVCDIWKPEPHVAAVLPGTV